MFFCKKDKKTQVQKKAEHAVQSTHDDLKSLKGQVEVLLKDRVTPAIVNAADKADQMVHSTKELTDGQVEQVFVKVKSKPLMAIVISVVVGYLLGRVIR